MTARWVDRLEKPLRFLEVPNLPAFMAGMNALSALLRLFRPEFTAQLVLDPVLIRHGQVWRALTFILNPPDLLPLWMFFWLILYYTYLSTLARAWGDFKLTLYVLIGALATAAASVGTGVEFGSSVFVVSLFLAFARLNPDVQILLFFFVPVKMKWLGLATWLAMAWSLLFGGRFDRLAIIAGLLNYALYFGPEHWQELKFAWRRRRFQA